MKLNADLGFCVWTKDSRFLLYSQDSGWRRKFPPVPRRSLRPGHPCSGPYSGRLQKRHKGKKVFICLAGDVPEAACIL